VEFLRRTIHEHPGDIVLLTIGPLSNIGLLFRTDPEVASLLRGLVMMCGVFAGHRDRPPSLEWNALCDPHALAIVDRTAARVHRSVGLDVTRQVTMDAKEFRDRLTSRLHQPVLDFARFWFEERASVTFHDPLAAATVFDDQVCVFQRGTVDVDLTSENAKGMTLWKPDRTGEHEVALEVDSARFFEHYFSVFQ